MALALALGAISGMLLGAVGGGGSVLTIPMLVYMLGLGVHEATGTALLIVGANSVVGVAAHARKGMVRWRDGALFGLLGIGGAVLGSRLNPLMPDIVILGGIAALMLAAALQMWRSAQPGEHRFAGGSRPWPAVAGTGIGVGLLTGFFGVGGGFVIVPALVLVLGLTMPYAIGTSLLVIALNSAAGATSFVIAGHVDFDVAALFIAGGALGTILGATVGQRVGDTRLREAFALILVAVALLLTSREAADLIT